MGSYSRNKGVRGEKLWAAECQKAGFTDVHRVGQQMYQRGAEVADVEGMEGVHFEIKNVEKLNVRRAMEQSERDAAPDEVPVLCHKSNRKPWLVTMLGRDWLEFYRAYRSTLSPIGWQKS